MHQLIDAAARRNSRPRENARDSTRAQVRRAFPLLGTRPIATSGTGLRDR